MSDIAIKVEGLGKEYIIGHQKQGDLMNSFNDNLKRFFQKKEKESFWALKDLNFEIKKGEAVGIIGRNGAGKSTLLKILSRITEPTTGRFEINGRVSSLLEVGTGFHPELSGRENIYLNGTILGMKRREIKAKFDEIIAFSGVEKFLDTPVKHYSSGMKVRLAFSVAAHLEPEILIIDEVLAVGDAEFQKKCLGKMDEVSKGEGRTVIFVSHNMGAVQNLCSSGILLNNSVIEQNGSISSVVRAYLNNKDSNLELNERKDRTGTGHVLFTDIKIIDVRTSSETSEIISGSEIAIQIHYESTLEEETIAMLDIGLSFFNVSGQFLALLNNRMANYSFYNVASKGIITCLINKFPLMVGDFYVTASMAVNLQVSDQIDQAIKIKVLSGDYFNSGFINDKGRQGVYIPQKWTFD